MRNSPNLPRLAWRLPRLPEDSVQKIAEAVELYESFMIRRLEVGAAVDGSYNHIPLHVRQADEDLRRAERLCRVQGLRYVKRVSRAVRFSLEAARRNPYCCPELLRAVHYTVVGLMAKEGFEAAWKGLQDPSAMYAYVRLTSPLLPTA